MNQNLSISKKKINFLLESGTNKGYEQIQIRNINSTTRIGFKIRSTNISRYIVNPTAAIIEPSQFINIDILLTLQEKDDISKITDKFCIYSLEIKDEEINMTNVEKYIKSNSDNLKKYYLKVSINRKNSNKNSVVSKEEENITNDNSLYNSLVDQKRISVVENFEMENKQNMISVGNDKGNQGVNFMKKRDSVLESTIMDKDNELRKLKSEKMMLEKDLKVVKEKIINKKYGNNLNENKTAIWKMLLFILLGFILGVFFNSK